jgi:hypothetical protein
VIATGPADVDEFNHHVRFEALIDRGAIGLVPLGSPHQIFADRIVQALESPLVQRPFDFDGWWRDVAESVDAQL